MAQEDHRVSDRCVWLSFPASDLSGWETKTMLSRTEAIEQQFDPLGEEPVDDVLEKSEQVHVALLALTESESFGIVLVAAPPGLEALRRMVRRWDPLQWRKTQSASATQFWFQIGANCKILPAGLEKWRGTSARRYERSKSRGTTTAALDDQASRQLHFKPSFQASWTSIFP